MVEAAAAKAAAEEADKEDKAEDTEEEIEGIVEPPKEDAVLLDAPGPDKADKWNRELKRRTVKNPST